MDKDINITLKVWRQKGPNVKGQFETYQLKNINQGTSFLAMLDILNEQLISDVKNLLFLTMTVVKVSAVCVHCM